MSACSLKVVLLMPQRERLAMRTELANLPGHIFVPWPEQ